MLKILGLVTITIAVLIVLMIGAPTISAQETTNWTTYYSPDYKFSFDYPDRSNISDLNGTWFAKSFISPIVGIIVNINKSSFIDPQELTVINSLILPPHQTLLGGGVHPVIRDGATGYYYLVINHKTASIMSFLHFSNNGNVYSFIIMGPNGSFDTRDTYMVMNSIKFFD